MMKSPALRIVIPVVVLLGLVFFLSVQDGKLLPGKPAASNGTETENTVDLPGAGWQHDMITIETPPDFKAQKINVEMAITQQQQKVGLMYRNSMPQDHGMLFIFEKDRPLAFWMKNTFIPLDMIFIDSSGTVTHVHKGARPLDLTRVRSQKPAMAVLELNAGAAERMGIVTGSRIRHAAFNNAGGE